MEEFSITELTKKDFFEYIKKCKDGNFELSLKSYIKDNFGDEYFMRFKKEYEQLNESEKKEWAQKLVNILKEKIQ